MKCVVVTSFGQKEYKEYAENFIRSWRWHWPKSIELICYTHNQDIPKVRCVNLEETEPARSFLDRHKDNKLVQGLQPTDRWKSEDRERGYCFRYDAYKFGRKAFVMAHCMRSLPRETKLFWLDADIITHFPVPDDFLDCMLPDNMPLTFLPGQSDLTETSCVGYNLTQEDARSLIEEMEDIYARDKFMSEVCWDDGHIFDYLVERRRPRFRLILGNQHPFDASVLGRHLFHFRGDRKSDEDLKRRYLAYSKAMSRRKDYIAQVAAQKGKRHTRLSYQRDKR